MAGIWVNFANLQDIMGKDMATVLCRARGGVSFYVPKAAQAGHDLVRIIGVPAFRALVAVYGGEVIVVPNYRRGTPRKGTILKLLEQGVSMRDIAMRLDVTERYVEHIAACVRPKHAQRSLLEYITMHPEQYHQ